MTVRRASRKFLVPEVVQTSAMDCGPAALKCLLEGFGIPVSYGRLREACQTDVDGTSIDTIEVVANQLGVEAEQMMLPTDHLLLRGASVLPALIVVRQPSGGTHFVVVWRQLNGWLQLMDPAVGRRWVRRAEFMDEIYRHQTSVSADDWRTWAGSDEFLRPLEERLARIGAGGRAGVALRDKALADPGWFGLGALDASVRLVQSVIDAGGLKAGAAALCVLEAVFDDARTSAFEMFRIIPPPYWMVRPDLESTDPIEQRLILRGAALLRVTGRHAGDLGEAPATAPPLPAELATALRERPARPLWALLSLMRDEGVVRPVVLVAAIAAASAALLIETLLFRALLDASDRLNLGSQRLAAIGAVLIFVALRLVAQVPIVTESMRLGRHLEMRLRMALLSKMPRLTDRYFQSRPVSDMADRGHVIHTARLLPGMAAHLAQALSELLLTLGGIILIDPSDTGLALAIAVAAIGVPAAAQPLMQERDLRVRNHTGALGGFYLDALIGLVPVRVHRAERAVRRQHEGLLVEWARAGRHRLTLSICVDGAQSLLCVGLAGGLLFSHFTRTGNVTGGDLLLVYWTLKLPVIGQGLTTLAQQLPMQQNSLARLMEPLSAPEEEAGSGLPLHNASRSRAVSITIREGIVVAAGHEILRDLNLTITPGEHIAIVGASGAGKSTLIGLLLGWHRLSTGALCVDGAPMTSDTRDALRRGTAWVDPAIQIWNRSFADNLGYSSEDGGLTRIGDTVDAAGLRGVLRNLPEGLQTKLGEGGALISGGEGQRVRLGRAVAQRDVRLVLLDEPFRGMDRDRRSASLADARKRWRGVTMLCVTHDVGETRLFDRVLVVDNGRIVEDGQPERLAAASSRYQRLLNAEREVLDQLWGSEDWRRIAIRDGRAHEVPAHEVA
ncbi:MAG TPA: cysteine peptidase family C39 domain-containing protein [Acetobacteraceae bacterium]|nr:cysteine peptidase family C39 domain-containing protein [Acetobacteraceae bacterium]